MQSLCRRSGVLPTPSHDTTLSSLSGTAPNTPTGVTTPGHPLVTMLKCSEVLKEQIINDSHNWPALRCAFTPFKTEHDCYHNHQMTNGQGGIIRHIQGPWIFSPCDLVLFGLYTMMFPIFHIINPLWEWVLCHIQSKVFSFWCYFVPWSNSTILERVYNISLRLIAYWSEIV